MASPSRTIICHLTAILISCFIVDCLSCIQNIIHDNTVTEDDIKDVLDSHNLFRSMVALGNLKNQPAAQNMQVMLWDDKLAKRAQYWSDQCEFRHDDDRGEGIGQNIFITYYFGKHSNQRRNFTKAVESWFLEHEFYTFKKVEIEDFLTTENQTGHYTQVIWAGTNRVGCGYTSYYNTEMLRDEILYVCNYSPAGNYIGKYPYKEGQRDCKRNRLFNSDIAGLCKDALKNSEIALKKLNK